LEGEWICYAGKRFHGRVRQRGDELLIVPKMPGKIAAGVEVVLAMRIDRDLAIFVFDFLA
jgi:hypothetical protein